MERLYRKISLAIWMAYFPIFYYTIKILLKYYEAKISDPTQLKLKMIGNVGTVAFLIPMALFSFLYYYDFEFLRKYKANDAEWPWKVNKKKFI